MAEYMVVDAEQLESDLTVVADAIREVAGTEGSLAFPHGMKAAIEGISSEPQIDGYYTIGMGETIEFCSLSEDSVFSTPEVYDESCDKGDNPEVIEFWCDYDRVTVEAASEGTTIFTMSYQYERELFDENGDNAGFETATRTLRYVITVTSGGEESLSNTMVTHTPYSETGEFDHYAWSPFDSPDSMSYSILYDEDNIIDSIECYYERATIRTCDSGVAVVIFSYDSYNPDTGNNVHCTDTLVIDTND